MKNKYSSRRDFLKKSAIATGVATLSPYNMTDSMANEVTDTNKLAREVSIATVSQMDLLAKNSRSMVEKIFHILQDNMALYQPDIICLPEVFPFANIEDRNTSWEEKLKVSSEVLDQFSNFSKENKCYVICPVYTTEGGKIYISAVVFDRTGSRLGEYRKIYVTEGEIEDGITPGHNDPPVFQTDFGKIGVQICFDVMWDDSWKTLREKGAEIVFFPSAFAAGKMVNAKAWQNMYIIVSSTQKDTSKICDFTGEVISQTGRWSKNFICTPVNLEKVFLHTWPSYQHFEEIKKKYGKKIKITTFHEEEWSIIESLSSDVLITDILKDFNLKSKKQLLQDAEKVQNKARQI